MLTQRLIAFCIGALNAARGRLKTVLEEQLWRRKLKMLRGGKCPNQAEYIQAYEVALVNLKCWPLFEYFTGKNQKSISAILMSLSHFPPMGKGNTHGVCWSCPTDWKIEVQGAISHTSDYFDGLCIDCMEMSGNLKHRDEEEIKGHWAAWAKSDVWNHACRAKHGESSWFHSWCKFYSSDIYHSTLLIFR